MRKTFRDNLLFLVIAHVCWLSEPAIINAQNTDYNPINFTAPLDVGRGSISPIGQDAFYFNSTERCSLLVQEWGWDQNECDAVKAITVNMGQDIDTIIISAAVSDGHVGLEDWTEDVSSKIDIITEEFKKEMRNQAKNLGETIEFVGWRLYPKVNKTNGIMYFAHMINWSGKNTLNITIVLFDRYGYVPMKVVPFEHDLSSDQIKSIVDQAVASYTPNTGSSYFEFVDGDKVASYGALSVFAGLLGVKYGKAVGTGILAVALILLKKAWFVILLPFIWLGKLFNRKPTKLG